MFGFPLKTTSVFPDVFRVDQKGTFGKKLLNFTVKPLSDTNKDICRNIFKLLSVNFCLLGY